MSLIPDLSSLRVGISSLSRRKADGVDLFDDVVDGASITDVWCCMSIGYSCCRITVIWIFLLVFTSCAVQILTNVQYLHFCTVVYTVVYDFRSARQWSSL